MFSVSKKRKQHLHLHRDSVLYIAYRDRFIAPENVSNKKQNFLLFSIISLSNQKRLCICVCYVMEIGMNGFLLEACKLVRF